MFKRLNDDIIDKKINGFLYEHKKTKVIHYVGPLFVSQILNKYKKSDISIYFNLNENYLESNLEGILFCIYSDEHFSLIFHWKKNENILYHYDSIPNYHKESAYILKKILKKTNILNITKFKIVTPNFCPLQNSHWECGYFVYLISEIIISKEKITPLSKADSKRNIFTFSLNNCLLEFNKIKSSNINNSNSF